VVTITITNTHSLFILYEIYPKELENLGGIIFLSPVTAAGSIVLTEITHLFWQISLSYMNTKQSKTLRITATVL
jgi:hypothetical protein